MEGVVKMDNNYLVDIQHERLSFFTPAGEVKALNDVSIHLKEGEVLGIVGESGSGKSVTAYSLMGLTAYPGKLIGGELHFNGHEVEKMTEKDFSKMRGKEVSIIFQDPLTSLNPVYTIGNQIMEVIRLHTDADKKKAYARAVELLSLVGINEPEKRMKQYPHELSGGMRQRVMIAIALACEPKLLIADEPTTALDVTIQAQIMELMKEMKEKKMEKSIKKLCYLALFCAIAIVLSYIESLIPLYLGVPGAKLGLANVVTLTLLLCFGLKEAFIVMFLRILIVSMTFTNFYMFLYSLSGGLLSLIIMYLFLKTNLFSDIIISIMGGIFHNVGQLLVAMLFFSSTVFMYYLPYLMLFGILSGIVIGILGEIIYLKIGNQLKKRG